MTIVIKFGRMEIPKSEEDVRKISEEIEKSIHQHSLSEEGGVSRIDAVVHQLEHIQELLIHVIQSIREVRDSMDNLTSAIRRSTKIIALGFILSSTNDMEIKKRIAEIILKDVGLDAKDIT